MLRWFGDVASQGEAWGVDINASAIYWCQRHLNPPFKFVTATTFPHLPFEDSSFDLIYAGSVFTHITDLADGWLLELRRIVRPGGKLYLSVFNKTTVKELAREGVLGWPKGYTDADGQELDLLTSDYGAFAFDRDYNSTMFYDLDYLSAKWSRMLEVEAEHPRAYSNQTVVLLKKR